MTYEEAKKLIARAEELAQAARDGKIVEFRNSHADVFGSANATKASEFYFCLMRGTEYRIRELKTRRPWTSEEAERHVGWVLVAPIGKKALIVFTTETSVRWSREESFSFERLSECGWKVHPIGQPDKIKPAYVEE